MLDSTGRLLKSSNSNSASTESINPKFERGEFIDFSIKFYVATLFSECGMESRDLLTFFVCLCPVLESITSDCSSLGRSISSLSLIVSFGGTKCS